MACVPAVLKDVVKFADPPLRATVPRVADPEAKVTLPMGVGPSLVTFAVRVTFCPGKTGIRRRCGRGSGSCRVHSNRNYGRAMRGIVCVTGVLSSYVVRSNGQSCQRQRSRAAGLRSKHCCWRRCG